MKLKFLGTGGGRFTTGLQRRRTAGTVVKTEETQLHIDPGPGALVYSRKELENPEDTEAVVVTHGHMDHFNDAQAIIEMITQVSEKPGALFANRSCLGGYSNIDKSVSRYHQDLCKRVKRLEEGTELEFKDLKIRSQQMFHSDPKTQGIVIDDGDRKVGFWTDSKFSEELLDFYQGCDIMVINTVSRKKTDSGKHTNVKEAVRIAEEIDPNATIFTHFGLGLLDNLEENKEWVEENTDQKIVWAEDGMEFPGNRTLESFH